LIGTAFFAYSSNLLAKIAEILGKDEDSERYGNFSRQAREAFVKHFALSDGTLKGGTQTSYVLALHFDLLPKDLRLIAVAELVQNIERMDNHLSTGFVGTPYLNLVLSEMDHLETAYALLKQTTWPSWLYSVTQGATTIWERWDGWTHDKGFQDQGMNSFNHYAYGAVGAWMYSVIGGIDLDPDQPGYKHIIMHPQPGGGLTHAKAELHSMYGLIRSEWTLQNDTFDWKITVPGNTTAIVYVPSKDASQVTENGHAVENTQGITFLRTENGFAVFDVESGSYSFSSRLDNPA
jgi:alpha-L-rhamnosidase